MTGERNHIDSVLDLIELEPYAGPMVEVFRESADLSKAEGEFGEELSTTVCAPSLEDPTTSMIITITDGWVADRVKLAFYIEDLEKDTDNPEEEGLDPWGSVSAGYGFTLESLKLGQKTYTVEPQLPQSINLMDPKQRWAMGRISRVGELYGQYFEANPLPIPQIFTAEEAVHTIKGSMAALKEQNRRIWKKLERQQKPPSPS